MCLYLVNKTTKVDAFNLILYVSPILFLREKWSWVCWDKQLKTSKSLSSFVKQKKSLNEKKLVPSHFYCCWLRYYCMSYSIFLNLPLRVIPIFLRNVSNKHIYHLYTVTLILVYLQCIAFTLLPFSLLPIFKVCLIIFLSRSLAPSLGFIFCLHFYYVCSCLYFYMQENT